MFLFPSNTWALFILRSRKLSELPSRLLNLRAYLAQRERMAQEFAVGNTVIVPEPKNKTRIFVAPECQENFPGGFGEVNTGSPRKMSPRYVPATAAHLLYEVRAPFRIVGIQRWLSPAKDAWFYLRGQNAAHPLFLTLENDEVVIGPKRLHLAADIFKKVTPP